MVGVYTMTEHDALNRGGIYSYSPGMELANDNRYFYASYRCAVMDYKVAKPKNKGAKFTQHIAPSNKVVVLSLVIRIRDRSVLQNGEEVYQAPTDARGYPHILASSVYQDWAEPWRAEEDPLVPRPEKRGLRARDLRTQ